MNLKTIDGLSRETKAVTDIEDFNFSLRSGNAHSLIPLTESEEFAAAHCQRRSNHHCQTCH